MVPVGISLRSSCMIPWSEHRERRRGPRRGRRALPKVRATDTEARHDLCVFVCGLLEDQDAQAKVRTWSPSSSGAINGSAPMRSSRKGFMHEERTLRLGATNVLQGSSYPTTALRHRKTRFIPFRSPVPESDMGRGGARRQSPTRGQQTALCAFTQNVLIYLLA